jgi:glycosyltransferase involved in cell wall biosynthesis
MVEGRAMTSSITPTIAVASTDEAPTTDAATSVQPQVPLSVLMCVFNGEQYVAAAIKSILNQTFKDFEFVVVDDGSADSTPRILEEFAQRDRRIRVVTQSNQGLPLARNRAVKAATADIVAWMDADDISEPKRMELQLEYLATHPECIVVGGQWACIDEVGRILYSRPAATDHASIVDSLLNGVNELANPAVMIRKKALDTVGLYNPKLRVAEDTDLWLRLYKQGKFANLPDRVLRYRLHEKQTNSLHWTEQTLIALTRVNEERGSLQLELLPIPERPQRLVNDVFNPTYEMAMQCWHYGYCWPARRLMIKSLIHKPLSLLNWLYLIMMILGVSQSSTRSLLSRMRWLRFWK